jgi:uncharacterized protein (DUF433 family)
MTQRIATWQDRIEIDPARLGGKPVVRGSRITVELVVGMVADGWSEARILDEYPTLTAEDVRACLHYAAAMLREERRFSLPAA